MKVTTAYDGRRAIVRLEGRLDGEWAEQLSDTLAELLRLGARTTLVDMGQVTYISSAGVKALMHRAQDYAALRGELVVLNPSVIVKDTLVLAGLGDRLLRGGDAGARVSIELDQRGHFTQEWQTPRTAARRARMEVALHRSHATLSARVVGDPARTAHGEITAADCTTIECNEQVLAVGTGAIGETFDDAGPRFGELVAAAGAVAYLPTDGGLVPDYLVMMGGRAPRALLADGVVCTGEFAQLARFSVETGVATVPFSELAASILELTATEAAGFVMVAETASLVGAWRRRSPALADGGLHFDVPAVRDDLSFTTERAHENTTTLVAGVIAHKARAEVAAMSFLRARLRPLTRGGDVLGHVHAVVFSYRPVPMRTVALPAMVSSLFANQAVRGILHLLADDRDVAGVGESEFVRGLLWTSGIGEVHW